MGGNVLYSNAGFAKMHGYSVGDLPGKNIRIFHNSEQWKHIKALFNRIKKTGKSLNNEKIWGIRRDGTTFPILVNTWLIRDRSDRPSVLCGSAIDISELEANKKTLEAMLNASSDLVLLMDKDLKYVDMNENMRKGLKLPREQLIGKYSLALMKPEVAAIRKARAEEAIATGKPVVFEHSDHGRIFCASCCPVSGVDGKVTGIVVFAKDITEQKLSEAEAYLYREELIKLRRNAYLDLVSAMMGHQLGQPLTTINMLMDETIEGVEKGKLEKEKLTEVLKMCLRETQLAMGVIKKVREHTNQWMSGRIERFNADKIIKDVISLLEPKARRAKMRIDVINLKSLPAIPGYRNAFEQVVFTIVENAIEAADSEKGHRLTIRAEKLDDHIELAFSDDCCGVPDENLEKIFEPFYSTKARKGSKCLGLGLPMARRILTAMGGKIRVDSIVGKGTTFYVSWPLS